MIPNDEQSDKGSHNMHRIATRYMHVDRCNETVPSVESAGQLLLSHTHSIVLPAFYFREYCDHKQTICAWMMSRCDVTPVVWPNKAVAVVQHHAIQIFILCVEPHLNVTSEVRVALWPVGLLQLVTQQAGHTLHLHLLLSDEDLYSTFPIAWHSHARVSACYFWQSMQQKQQLQTQCTECNSHDIAAIWILASYTEGQNCFDT